MKLRLIRQDELSFPFLFFGQGYSTSRKCLECLLWLDRSPTQEEKDQIEKSLPEALSSLVEWNGPILHCGSDDILEGHVRAQYGEPFQALPAQETMEKFSELGGTGASTIPTELEWKSFCRAVEQWVRSVHEVCPVRIFVKADDGHYGQKLGAWDEWSVSKFLKGFSSFGFDAEAPTGELATAARGLIMYGVRSAAAARSMPEAERTALADWLRRLLPVAGSSDRQGLAKFLSWLDANQGA